MTMRAVLHAPDWVAWLAIEWPPVERVERFRKIESCYKRRK